MSKKIVILMVAVVLLAAGVGAAWFMQLGPFAPPDTTEGRTLTAPQAPRFVILDPFFVPVLQGDQLIATAQLEVRIEVLGSDTRR